MNSKLEIQNKKIELIQWLSTIEDIKILEQISTLISSKVKNDWGKDVLSIEKESISKGKQDADNGKLNPHAKAKEIYAKWL